MDTKEKDLETLMNKYAEGQTSLEEERFLRDYFSAQRPVTAEHHFFADQKELSGQSVSADFEVLSKKFEERVIKWPVAAAIGIAATVLLSAVAFYMYSRYAPSEHRVIVKSNTSIMPVILPDGSTVTLNANARIEYPEVMDKNRTVTLQGEAFFEVANDPVHPFIISAAGTKTEVVGTSFDINTSGADQQTVIIVVSGTVKFSADANAGDTVTLQAGSGASFNIENKTLDRTPFDPNAIAWKTHRLEFRDTPLQEVLTRLETYFKIRTKITNNKILDCRFKGAFDEPTLEAVFQVMRFTLDIDIVKEGDVYSVSGKGCKE